MRGEVTKGRVFFELARQGDACVLFTLLDKYNVNVLNAHGQNLLQEAISSGRYDVAVKLLGLNINIDNADYKGQIALHFLVERNLLELVQLIIRQGPNCR